MEFWDLFHRFEGDLLTLAGEQAPEPAGVFCAYDDLLFAGLAPAVRWERTRTIARGGPLCDFRFERGDSRRQPRVR